MTSSLAWTSEAPCEENLAESVTPVSSVPSPTEMRILIAGADQASCRELEAVCRTNGYEPVVAANAREALAAAEGPEPPAMALVDSTSQDCESQSLITRLRQAGAGDTPLYIILLAPRSISGEEPCDIPDDVDDCVLRPLDPRELRARLRVGRRLLRLQYALTERVLELESALGRVKNLQGLLPMCSYCKRIRNDRNYWQQVESYIAEHSNAEFTHGVCPHCYETIVKREMERLRAQQAPSLTTPSTLP